MQTNHCTWRRSSYLQVTEHRDTWHWWRVSSKMNLLTVKSSSDIRYNFKVMFIVTEFRRRLYFTRTNKKWENMRGAWCFYIYLAVIWLWRLCNRTRLITLPFTLHYFCLELVSLLRLTSFQLEYCLISHCLVLGYFLTSLMI